MNPLLLGFLREVLPWRWQLFLVVAVFTFASLSFDASLGAHSLGTYLAYLSVLPTVLLFRVGAVLDLRAQQGWPQQEILRDRSGRKAPLVEILACAVLLCSVLLLGLAPLATGLFPMPEASSGLYPVRVQFETQEDGAELWLFDLGSRVPENARLQLTLDWSEASVDPTLAKVQSPERQVQPIPGKLLRWDLSAAEARVGKLVLHATTGSGLHLRKHLCRLEIPRPNSSALPRLVAHQFLFFLPLFAILIAWFRFGRISGSLSAMTAFTIGTIAAMQVEPVDLGSGPMAALAKMLLLFKLSLPPVEGLLATGQRFDRLADTTPLASIIAWLLIGALALGLACRRRPPRHG
ncbi:MAG: hypothetical protein QM477_04515 [Planctomycetota bacterium]